jgi:hypothetical protein
LIEVDVEVALTRFVRHWLLYEIVTSLIEVDVEVALTRFVRHWLLYEIVTSLMRYESRRGYGSPLFCYGTM